MVERTLPKPDTRVRFPSAALQSLLPHGRRLFAAEAGIASRRKYIPSRARDFRLPARQPLQKPRTSSRGFSYNLDGSRRYVPCSCREPVLAPRRTPLMSRRNIPASPLPLSSPLRAGGVVGADARCRTNRGTLGLGRVCAERGKGYSGEVPQTARRETKVGSRVWWWFRRDVSAPSRGIGARRFQHDHASAHGPAIPSWSDIRVPESCEGGSPVGAKEVYSEPAAYASKHLKNIQLTT